MSKSNLNIINIYEQAGAELCQAQFMLGLAKLSLPNQPAKLGFSGQG